MGVSKSEGTKTLSYNVKIIVLVNHLNGLTLVEMILNRISKQVINLVNELKLGK